MRWFLISLITIFTLFNFSYAETMSNKIMLKNGTPKGVIIKNNKVTLKSGYKFEKVSNSRVNVVSRMRGQGITGTFDCTCNGNEGGCDVITTGSSVSCAKSTCSSSCYMIVTIPGGPTKFHQ